MLRTLYVSALVFLVAGPAGAQPALPQAPRRTPAAYHFSPTGNDDTGNGSEAAPWATIAKANGLDLDPGDRVLFMGGATFSGGLTLDAQDAGTAAEPVVIGSYGTGRATINAGGGAGVYAYNVAGLEVRDLVVRGTGVATNTTDGVSFYMDRPGAVKLEHVRIDNVEASGFGKYGIAIGSWNGLSGYRDVRVTNVAVHGNRNGVFTYAQSIGGIEDLYVGGGRFYNNPGKSGLSTNSGSGLIVSGVRRAVVERNVAYGNGAASSPSAGPVGIWAYDADQVVIRYNESYNNRTGHTAASGGYGGDGGGFDLDGGVTNSVLEYNYSHGNDGAGFLLAQYSGAPAFGGNVVRYNVSENDGRRNGYAGVTVWAASGSNRVRNTQVYHNTVYVDAAGAERPTAAVRFLNGNHSGLAFRNNVLVTAGGARAVSGGGGDAVFQGNGYWAASGALAIHWSGTTHASLDAWRTATGRERLSGAPVGFSADPRLRAPGAGGVLADVAALGTAGAPDAYRLQAGSPAATAAVDLVALGLAPGPADFYGTPLGASGGRSVGAHESSQATARLTLDAGEGWYPVAVPVGGATVGGVLGPVWTQGFPGADRGADAPSVFVYDETQPGAAGAGWAGIAGASSPLRPGAGVLAYVFADDDQDAPGVQGGFPKTLTAEGPVVGLPFQFTGLGYTDTGAPAEDGWALLGNPIDAALDWDAPGWVRSGVSDVVYVYDTALAEYRTWNGTAGALAGGEIPAGRAFFVQATGPSPALTAPAAARVTPATASASARAAAVPGVELRLTGRADGAERGASVFLTFGTPAASVGPDAADAYALSPLAQTYVSAAAVRAGDGAALATAAFPDLPQTADALGGPDAFEVPLATGHAGLNGPAMEWRWPQTLAPESGWRAALVDREAGRTVDLAPGGAYAFDAGLGEAGGSSRLQGAPLAPRALRTTDGSAGPARFALRFSRVGAVESEDGPATGALVSPLAPNPTAGRARFTATLPTAARLEIAAYDVVGRRVLAVEGAYSAGRQDVDLDLASLAPGPYVVRVVVRSADGTVAAHVRQLSVVR